MNTDMFALKYLRNSVNKIFYKIDRFLYVKYLAQPRPLFILGAPRSGTTLFYQAVTQNLKVTYFPSPMKYMYGLANGMQKMLKPWIGRSSVSYESSYGYISGWLAPTEDANYWMQWFPHDGKLGHRVSPDIVNINDYDSLILSISSIEAIAKRPLVVKCLYLDMNAGLLARLFPDARFIHMHRNSVKNCQSILVGRNRQKDPTRWWSVKIPNYHKLLNKPIVQQICEQYYSIDRILSYDLNQYADRVFDVQYELFCQDPNTVFDKLENWLEPVGYEPYAVRQLPKKFVVSEKKLLDTEIIEVIDNYLKYLSHGHKL